LVATSLICLSSSGIVESILSHNIAAFWNG
jgi:hypothetical protein